MTSLQDQLLQAGLINKQKAKQAQTEKRKKFKQKKKKGTVNVSLVQKAILEQQSQQKTDDLNKNKRIQEELSERSDHGKLIQMIAQHCEKEYQGEIDYHFNYQNKVKRIAINASTKAALTSGRLAICALNDAFYLINREASEKLKAIDESVLVAVHEKPTVESDHSDDFYAEFAVPDDISW